ncbi:MAG: leucine-rich repeat domain-containing protein, partial [Oscillospiraceae bacterium]|nr:leucine-rich repeat domain-containing protein [Oscillospiraceae bacterium]
MKRVIAVFLTLILLLGLLPISSVSAATYSGYEGSLKWTLDTSTGKLTISGNGAMPNNSDAYSYAWFDYEEYIKTVSISEGVTSIGDYAFYSYPNLTKMSLGHTVTSIGQYAFYNCDALTTTDTGYVQSLGACAFYCCDGLTSVSVSGQTTSMGRAAYADCKNLTTVIVGNGAYIGAYAFSGCTKLSTVHFSTEVSTIGSNAFSSCPIESITLPAGLKTIGEAAFSSCTKLTSVTIPANVSFIGENPFQNCSALTGIYVADGNQYFKSVGGVLYDIDGTTILSYPKGKASSSFYAEDTVSSVAPKAFYGCTNLGYVTFCSDLTKIGKSAFEDCYGLLSVSFSGTVQTVSELAFSGCTTLRSITLSGVELIDKNAFETCKSMTSLSIEGSPKIADEAFAQCYALRYLDLGDTYEIGYRAFYEAALRDFTLPASVRYVGREAFGYCLDMTKITVLNPACKFYNWENSETFWGYADAVYTFHGYENSTAKAYADLYGHSFTAHSFDEDGYCTRCGCEPYAYDDGFWSYEAVSGVAYIYGFGETVPSHHYDGPQSWHDFDYAIT